MVLVAAGNEVLVGWVTGVCLGFLPLATGAAVLRYRLFDLDRIISRKLSYGLLTIILGLDHAGMVLGLGQLLGQDSSLAVAGATLAVAAVFSPPVGASKGRWTGASPAATTPPPRSRRSAPGCGNRSTWTP